MLDAMLRQAAKEGKWHTEVKVPIEFLKKMPKQYPGLTIKTWDKDGNELRVFITAGAVNAQRETGKQVSFEKGLQMDADGWVMVVISWKAAIISHGGLAAELKQLTKGASV